MDYYTYFKFVKAAYVGVKKGLGCKALIKSVIKPAASFVGTSVISDIFG